MPTLKTALAGVAPEVASPASTGLEIHWEGTDLQTLTFYGRWARRMWKALVTSKMHGDEAVDVDVLRPSRWLIAIASLAVFTAGGVLTIATSGIPSCATSWR